MNATANEEDVEHARAFCLGDRHHDARCDCIRCQDVNVLAKLLAAVRAPLEARIAELESALSFRSDALDTLERERATAVSDVRVMALREAAEVCWNGVPITLDIQASVLRKARDAILALIESPAVKP